MAQLWKIEWGGLFIPEPAASAIGRIQTPRGMVWEGKSLDNWPLGMHYRVLDATDGK